MSNKACLTNAELELTQRIQTHFPRGIMSVEVLQKWNGCSAEVITKRCIEAFEKFPKPVLEPLLDFIGTVEIPATTEMFVARDKFVRNTDKKTRVKISYLGDNFAKQFLSKIEKSLVGGMLRYGTLRKSSVDSPIIAELGGEQKSETTLAEMFALMERQGNGQRGPLLTNSYANIFYIRDINGVLWAVDCDWDGDGWRVRADSVGVPDSWYDGSQVFSRNPSETQS